MADQFALPGFEPPQVLRQRVKAPHAAAPRHGLFFGVRPAADELPGVEALVAPWRDRFDASGGQVESTRLHITCCDLGSFVDAPPPELIDAAREVAAGLTLPAFEIVFERVMRFRGNGALVLLERAGATPLKAFLDALGHALVQAGVPVDIVGTPHMTLCYGSGAVAQPLIEPVCWTVQAVHLIDSLVGQHLHRQLGHWPLVPPR
jgi:2'-5' RNA ligase